MGVVSCKRKDFCYFSSTVITLHKETKQFVQISNNKFDCAIFGYPARGSCYTGLQSKAAKCVNKNVEVKSILSIGSAHNDVNIMSYSFRSAANLGFVRCSDSTSCLKM